MTELQETEQRLRKRKERDADEQRAMAALSASGVVPIHAGVRVLNNRVLREIITSFVDGYPHVVHRFYQENDPSVLALRVWENDPRDWSNRRPDSVAFDIVGHLTESGVLPHLAIAADDPQMLQVLYKLSKYSQYQPDLKLSFRKVMRCAVAFNSIDMLECINELKAQDPGWKWEPNLMRLAVQRDDPDFQVLGWLYARLPRKGYPLLEKFMLHQAKRGALDVVQWLDERGRKISRQAMDEAAKRGHIEVLRYFYKHSGKRCTSSAVTHAALNGYLDIVELAVDNQKKPLKLGGAVLKAAGSGHLEMVKYLVEKNISFDASQAIANASHRGHLGIVEYLVEVNPGCSTLEAMISAASSGHVDIVMFLYQNGTDGCHSYAMDFAAQSGHLEVVKFLFETFGWSCPTSTMDKVAMYGHLEVMKFLHQSCAEGYTTDAMDGAAGQGHLEIVKFLHFNRSEGCTANALMVAAASGHVDVIQFLCEHRSKGNVSSALREAALYCHFEAVKVLHGYLRAGESAYHAVEVAAQAWNASMIIKFLCEHQEREPTTLLKQAIASGAARVVQAVAPYSSLEELNAGKEYALEMEKTEVAALIAQKIQAKRIHQ